MQRELQKSMPSQHDLDEMKRQIAASVCPAQKQMDEMTRQVRELDAQPEGTRRHAPPDRRFHEELDAANAAADGATAKEMEQHKLDLQQMMKEFNPSPEF